MRTPKEAVAQVPPTSKVFSTFDATMGYFQVPLDEVSQPLTTFATPWGRYMHLRATMGLSCAGDEYNRRTDQALEGIKSLVKVVDDCLIHSPTMEQHMEDVREFLGRCREVGITLNPKKTKIAHEEVKFAGYLVGKDGVRPDPAKLKAIKMFPKPNNISDLRSFLGLVEQLAGFSKQVSRTMGPLRPLLRPKSEFIWNTDHDHAFEATKQALVEVPVLATFDPKRKTQLQTDASRKNGLGYALLQMDEEERWRLIECGSRFITETEARYAMVELELLGVVWAMTKCRMYLLGLPEFSLLVDHQPLVTILDKCSLDSVDNPRLQRLKAKLTPYIFKTSWRKGKAHCIPDALSRAPVQSPEPSDLEEDEEIFGYVCSVVNTLVEEIGENEISLKDIQRGAANDGAYQDLVRAIMDGFPKNCVSLTPYRKEEAHLSCEDGIALHGSRIIVPKELRREVLKRLHASHQGVTLTLRRARQLVFWPGITSDIKNTVEACQQCQVYKPSLCQEPMMMDEKFPTRIFQHIAADYFEVQGNYHLVIVDRYSGWPQVYHQSRPPTSSSLIRDLAHFFSNVGCPEEMASDGGTQFTAHETKQFLKRWGVTQRVSTPHAFPTIKWVGGECGQECKKRIAEERWKTE